MKLNALVGIVLIVFGLIALAYGGITYTKTEKVIDLGPLQATTQTHERVPLPPILGGASLVGGIILLVMSGKKS